MSNRILTTVGWEERIRNKMGVDEAYLADSALQSPDVITIAEANIIAQIPEYASLSSDLKAYIEYAVVLECCTLLCPSMSARLPKKESGEHASHELGIDWDKKKTEFEDERETYIMKVIESAFPYKIPHINYFSVTFPERG